ncbi:NAD(P)-dependent alcohol dehydrogenase [Frankia sp. QA3]|uniref:NAD(P)-dependent alcohol dehydrogenase n=1 Tax=Frankia sp. QA3 TaxID=710111 RepID=UPI000269C7DE|nr:NAD(P)-dependent alcohol dehydrogenase [Frankia sp. QA3]EIV93647.1 Zn-dependent alcohol dehydrogenase [Frankia sp. QA3]
MRALRITRHQSAPELVEVPDPVPGPGQVRLRVAAAGACHSDLHLMEMPPEQLAGQGLRLPFTLGHESAGWVDAVGPGVGAVRVGDACAVYGPWGCGHCRSCARGAEQYCEVTHGAGGPGLGGDGGMAEYLLVDDVRHLVPLGDLDPVAAAPLTDAGLTPYHAIRKALPLLGPGSTAVVIGAGGLGHLGIQILRAITPARVVAVDVAPAKLAQALDLGAHAAVPAGKDAAAAIRVETAGGRGAQAVFDMVGSAATMATAAAAVGVEGRLTVVGLGGGALPFRLGAVPFDVDVSLPYWGTHGELFEVLDLARAGLIRAHVETVPLAGMPAAYDRLRAGEVTGRVVMVPSA